MIFPLRKACLLQGRARWILDSRNAARENERRMQILIKSEARENPKLSSETGETAKVEGTAEG